MKTRKSVQFLAVFLLATLASAGLSRANSITYNAVLTAASPVFNRPLNGTPPSGLSAAGTAVRYDVEPFFVSAPTAFTLETTAATLTPTPADDTFLVLYQNAFNPASPLTNALSADDDSGVGSLSLISANLVPGVQYFAVITTFSNAVSGPITTAFTAPAATVSLGVVPEPSTWAMLGVGLLAGFAMTTRRRKQAAV